VPPLAKKPWVRNVTVAAVLGAVAGTLCVLCVTPWNLWWLAPAAFAPLVIVCFTTNYAQGIAAGLMHGLVVTAGCLHFVLPAIHRMAHVPWVVSGLLWLLIALSHGLRTTIAVIVTQWGHRRTRCAALLFPAVWVLTEKYVPILFPWPVAVLAEAQLLWLQPAQLFGPLLVSGWIVSLGAAVGDIVMKARFGFRRVLTPLACALLILSVGTLSGYSLRQRTERLMAIAPKLRVAVVQGAALSSHESDRRDILERYRQATLGLINTSGPLDLVVWPESLLQGAITESSLQTHLQNYVWRDKREGSRSPMLTVPVALGLTIARATKLNGAQVEEPALTNSAILLSAEGRVAGRYDKQILMPVGESPLGIGAWEWISPVTRYQSGIGAGSLRLGNHPISVAICYEDLLSSHVRALVNANDSALLLSLSSDSWFQGTYARGLHFTLARLRAIETRRYLVRSTHDGISGLVSPTGIVLGTLPPLTMASGTFSAAWMHFPTLYQRLGDAPIVAFGAAWAILALLLKGRRRAVDPAVLRHDRADACGAGRLN